MTQVPMYSSFNDLVDLSVKHTGDSMEVDCAFSIELDLGCFYIRTASIASQDILLYTDNGTISFVVDIYGDTARAELFDWTLDDEE